MKPFPKSITIGEKYGPAMKIINQQKADEYFEACVAHMMTHGHDKAEAERIERSNLGYYAGYYDSETMARVNRLFKTTHPIFGDTNPTPAEAFEAGKKMAQA